MGGERTRSTCRRGKRKKGKVNFRHLVPEGMWGKKKTGGLKTKKGGVPEKKNLSKSKKTQCSY